MIKQITVTLEQPKIAFFPNQQGRHQTVHWTSFCQCDILHLSFVYNWIDEGNDLWCLFTRKEIQMCNIYIYIELPEKTADILRRHHWIPRDGNDVWGTSAEISYWSWRITVQIWVLSLIWSKQSSRVAQPIRTTTHTWLVNVIRIKFLYHFFDVISRANQFWRRDISVVFSG